jgi:hypothetical protein
LLALLSIVVCSTILRATLGLGRPVPWILPDELLYADLARSIADGGVPAVRGAFGAGWGVVYPALVAPAWALADDPVLAYHGALAANAVLMSFAAVPAYLLARLFVAPGLALTVAASSVLVPSMSLTGVVMTENAAYPAFLLAAWLVARTMRTPTVGAQVAALLAIGLVTLTRVQGGVLLLVYLSAAPLYSRGMPIGERWTYIRRYLPSAAVLLVLLVPLVALGATGDALGGRSGTFEAVRLAEAPRMLLMQLSDLLLYVVVVPALATAVVVGMGLTARASERQRLFAAVALPTIGATLISVTAVSISIEIEDVVGLNERYLVYVAPLMFTGLALWIDSGLPRPRGTRVVAAGVAVIMLSLPFDRLANDASFYAPALAPWVSLGLPDGMTRLCAATFGAVLGVMWLRAKPLTAGRLWVPVIGWMAFLGLVAVGSQQAHASHTATEYVSSRFTWVDDAVPPGHGVLALWDQDTASVSAPDRDYQRLMLAEFFNQSIGDVYRIGAATYYENVLPTRAARLGPNGVVESAGRPLEAAFVLAACALPIDGARVAETSDGRLILWRTGGIVHAQSGGSCSTPAG